MEWCHPGSPTPKKPRGEKSSQKMLATVFWDIHGIICIEFLPRGSTIDSDRYIQTLKKLKARIYRARPALEMQRVLFHHDNAPPHTSGKTRETIASIGWKTLPHPPYSPDLAPSDYHLFGPMKLHMKGMRHENVKTTTSSRQLLQNGSESSHQSSTGKVYWPLLRGGLKQSRGTESTSRIEMVFLRYVAVI